MGANKEVALHQVQLDCAGLQGGSPLQPPTSAPLPAATLHCSTSLPTVHLQGLQPPRRSPGPFVPPAY